MIYADKRDIKNAILKIIKNEKLNTKNIPIEQQIKFSARDFKNINGAELIYK